MLCALWPPRPCAKEPVRALLRALLERIMLDVMFDSPGRDDIAEITINRAVVEGKRTPLVRKRQDKDAA